MARGVGNDTETFSCESGRRGARYVLCGRGGGGILLQCAHTSVTCCVHSHYSPWGIVTSSIFVAVGGSSVLNNWNGSHLVAKISLRYGRINVCQFSSVLSPPQILCVGVETYHGPPLARLRLAHYQGHRLSCLLLCPTNALPRQRACHTHASLPLNTRSAIYGGKKVKWL